MYTWYDSTEERERGYSERERDRQRDRDRQTGRQVGRQTDRDRDKETERQRHSATELLREGIILDTMLHC